MDFTKFINSEDVRNYHREIGYKYSASEAAWLVYMCRSATLSEKHEAWKWIIENLSDETIYLGDEGDLTKSISLHGFLEDSIDMEETFIKNFTEDTEGKIYVLDEGERIFSAWENCIGYILDNKSSDYPWPAFVQFCNLNDRMPYHIHGNLRIDPDGKIKSVYSEQYSNYIYEKTNIDITILNLFQIIPLEFPSPFKDGDILCCFAHNGHKIPFVYSARNYFDEETLICGYSVYDSSIIPGSSWGLQMSFGDCWDYMTNIEYYREELTGKNRILLPVSRWIKGKYKNDLAQFLDDYCTIRQNLV